MKLISIGLLVVLVLGLGLYTMTRTRIYSMNVKPVSPSILAIKLHGSREVAAVRLAKSARTDEAMRPGAGNAWMVCRVSVRNKSKLSQYAGTYQLVDASGKTHVNWGSEVKEVHRVPDRTEAGKTSHGELLFNVPKNTRPARIEAMTMWCE